MPTDLLRGVGRPWIVLHYCLALGALEKEVFVLGLVQSRGGLSPLQHISEVADWSLRWTESTQIPALLANATSVPAPCR
jgi:hypothetical protein